ncbi:hypothetical protein BpHYR1_005068 [Brachionus plicatilis]|uniref:Uncharacterized protein n=1 Tax=Brachionus plicatilis TaxID=10195 RepID=A0A3M7T6A3_BRAPC|nr:hypothetical protein BpHYR1_005068 [Brachionus plicatilis]
MKNKDIFLKFISKFIKMEEIKSLFLINGKEKVMEKIQLSRRHRLTCCLLTLRLSETLPELIINNLIIHIRKTLNCKEKV